MYLVSLENISLKYSSTTLLRDITLKIKPGERIVVIGQNPVAKSSLLDLIHGQQRGHVGSIKRDRKLRIGYLPRNVRIEDQLTIFKTVMAGRAELVELRKNIDRLQEEAEGGDSRLIAQLNETQARFEREGGDLLERHTALALESVGFDSSQFDQTMGLLTAGERTRALLARMLVTEADLLLLDSPTRYLDIPATEFLERYLVEFGGTALVVSHDRAFLDRFATSILEVKRDGTTQTYPGKYEQYVAIKNERQTQPATEQASPDSDDFLFADIEPSGKMVFVVKNLQLRPGGQTLLDGASANIARGERVGIIGPSGCGKTSFLKTLAGNQSPNSGKIHTGKNSLIGFMDQELAIITSHKTVEQELSDLRPDWSPQQLHAMAVRFLFSEDDLARSVEDLSRGEFSRLSLAKLILGEHNVLLLDEPTSHLDIASCELIEQALQVYPGTVVVVSHDRTFLEKVTKRILSFENKVLVDEQGSYVEMRKQRQIMFDTPLNPSVAELTRKKAQRKPVEPQPSVNQKEKSPNRTARLKELVKKQEQTIEQLMKKMADPAMALDWEGLERLSSEKKALEKEYESNLAKLRASSNS